MSASCQQKKGRSRTRNSSNAASAFTFACAIGSPGRKPGTSYGRAAEWITALHGERVPIRDRETQVIPKRLSKHEAVGVVPAVREWILGVRPFISYGLKGTEYGVDHDFVLPFCHRSESALARVRARHGASRLAKFNMRFCTWLSTRQGAPGRRVILAPRPAHVFDVKVTTRVTRGQLECERA